MKGFLIGLVIVVVLLFGGFWLFGQDDENETPAPTNTTQDTSPDTTNDTSPQDGDAAQPGSTAVTLTDAGFTPDTVTISAGESVIFTNESSADMQVASNDHPDHDEYPGFDSLDALAPGQSYTFTFDNVGTWGYHNHLAPDNPGGTVIVTAAE